MYRTILFDLDGTLVDTAPDLAYALNVLRSRRGLPALADNLTRPQASHGTQGLLRVGFGVTQEQAEFSALREEFLEVYATHLTVHSPMFPGVAEMLANLEARGLKWGVVTNKPSRYDEREAVMRTPLPLRTNGCRKKEQEASGALAQNLKNLASEIGAGHFTIRAQRQHYGVRAGFAGLVTRRGQSHQKLIDLQAGDVHSASLSFYGAAPKEPCLVTRNRFSTTWACLHAPPVWSPAIPAPKPNRIPPPCCMPAS